MSLIYFCFFSDDMRSVIDGNNALFDYLRTMKSLQFYQSLLSNTIKYPMFLKNHFIIGYDLTCSQNAGNAAFSSPLVRTG